jgi:hypothetical protein
LSIIIPIIFQINLGKWHITLLVVNDNLPAPYKATRRVAGTGNVGEGGVGASAATDLAERSPSRRIGGLRIQSCYVQYDHFFKFNILK